MTWTLKGRKKRVHNKLPSLRERRGHTEESWAEHMRAVKKHGERWRRRNRDKIKVGRLYGDEFVEYLDNL